MIPLLAIIAVLFLSVYLTFVAKDREYGSTPFYASVGLTWQQGVGYPGYAIEHSLTQIINRIRAFFGAAPHIPNTGEGIAHGIPVLTYHNIYPESGQGVTIQNFKDQMEKLKMDGWQTITLEEYDKFIRGEIALPTKSVLLTFDDGGKQSYYPVDPILRALDFNAVSYIIINDMRRPESTYYLSEQEVRNMLESGRWEIGSHSVAGHIPYPLDAFGTEGHFFSDRLWKDGRLETEAEFRARIASDLRESKRDLEETFGVSVESFAFPFGDAGEASKNYPESTRVAEEEARNVYMYGLLQVDPGRYTYNYPDEDVFIMDRISVHPSWTGDDLLKVLQNGMKKDLPYRDEFAEDRGWLRSWGSTQIISDGLLITATASTTGSSAFLDGTRGWQNYEFVAEASWDEGYAILMAQVKDVATYRDCVFSDGHVQIQNLTENSRTILADRDDLAIRRGDVMLGIRVQGSSIQCIFDGKTVLSVSGLPREKGGIGVQVWSENLGRAHMTLSSISVRDVTNERLPAPRMSEQGADTPFYNPLIPNTGSPFLPATPQNTPPQPNLNSALPSSPEATPPASPQATSSVRDFFDRFLNRRRDESIASTTPQAATTTPTKKDDNRGRGRNRDRDGDNSGPSHEN